jgi:hypothetical protein
MIFELFQGTTDIRLIDLTHFGSAPETPHLSGNREVVELP